MVGDNRVDVGCDGKNLDTVGQSDRAVGVLAVAGARDVFHLMQTIRERSVCIDPAETVPEAKDPFNLLLCDARVCNERLSVACGCVHNLSPLLERNEDVRAVSNRSFDR